ncbi:MAG: hypothetical protein AB7P14_10175 [Blastocatellales bacterium]
MKYTRQQFLLLLLPAIGGGSRLFAEPQDGGKQTVEAFLKEWLIDRKAKSVMRFFHSRAFTSKLILSDPCIGELGDADRNNPRKVRLTVENFLHEVLKWSNGKSLREILKSFEPADFELKSGNILASPSQNGYLLIRGKSLEVEIEEDWQYLQSLFPSEEYLYLLSMVRIHNAKEQQDTEAAIYSIWALENENWRIIHLGMGCI